MTAYTGAVQARKILLFLLCDAVASPLWFAVALPFEDQSDVAGSRSRGCNLYNWVIESSSLDMPHRVHDHGRIIKLEVRPSGKHSVAAEPG
ncbi:hypothetical protein NEOLEDRAFT_1126751 [Neolentinus lepideus HHB14362 ss-1]|uniref:Secreted protein n=1 Tax=Neolentinus lepideus HHB14362 ss-1 TaxID=1314782 RepID=A0A165VQ95_9AGAM|nr:hypothetical protein NEOLEDRAFT_1126751 [Neolentinus lepideus HHB14362 ss-1]